MKAKETRLARIGLAILLGGFAATASNVAHSQVGAQVGLSVGLDIHSPSDFDSPLAPYGQWVNVSRYGRCWRPSGVASGWRPYSTGYWEWTDSGWYWMSDEPWSWACYHYGYWIMDPADGWVWVPGTDWAPAWVAWRESPDYIGWAPCGPGGVAVGDSEFVFVDVHHFHDHLGPRSLVFNDHKILERTREVRNFKREDRDFGGVHRTIFSNPGPGVDPIQRATGTKFTARPVAELVRQTPVPEAARRNIAQPNPERNRANQPPSTPTGREQQRLYREAPAAPPQPTGRLEQRLYRDAPGSQTAPAPQLHPAQPVPVPRREPVPEVHAQPPVPQEKERPLPSVNPERGKTEVPRREEPAPHVAPAPSPRPAPAAPPPEREKERNRDGQ